MKTNEITASKIARRSMFTVSKTMLPFLLCLGIVARVSAQKKIPVVRASSFESTIYDGKVNVRWRLDPKNKLDIYYLKVPRRANKVTLVTNQDKISFRTTYGKNYDLLVLVNGKDSCLVRISATNHPLVNELSSGRSFPDTIPFTLNGSRIYFHGMLNGKNDVNVQFDTNAGISCVSSASSGKLNLLFDGKTILSNTQGINEVRKSSNNDLAIGNLRFSRISLVETGNMQPGEDLIIGNYFFGDKIVEIDYDRKLFIVHEKLPAVAKMFRKQSMVYGLNLKTQIVQNGKKYTWWMGFDTGRDGTMLLREDFTAQPGVWENLKELTILNERKIVRLDATIAGITFKDIVTNAADPTKPNARKAGSLIGNVLLNHFNVIIDNRNGYMYLKPNSRINEPYSNFSDYEAEMKKLKQ